MPPEAPARLWMLRALLALDAVVLLTLGAVFMAIPGAVAVMFEFGDNPTVVRHSQGLMFNYHFVVVGTHVQALANYAIGLWGCALISLGIGYLYAAGNPVRNISWVRVGIVRGALECVFGFIVVAEHLVTWRQAAFGTIIAGAIAAGYLFLYPSEAA
jgi:hypothetical protein